MIYLEHWGCFRRTSDQIAAVGGQFELCGRAIIFNVVRNIPERHGRTDGQTDDLLWHNRALRSIMR